MGYLRNGMDDEGYQRRDPHSRLDIDERKALRNRSKTRYPTMRLAVFLTYNRMSQRKDNGLVRQK